MALKVLSALDTAKTQLYHFKAIVIAGMGLFTDAYDLFCIPPIMGLIGRVYYQDVSDKSQKYKGVPPGVNSTMLAIALLGTAIGQLVFGRLGDRVGRRRVYGIALMIMVLSSIGCGFSICRTRNCVLGSLGLFRFLLGFGIGGDYPLSATIMSEFANKMTRGTLLAAVFTMQGFGILAASTVTMVVCKIFDATSDVSVDPTPPNADIAWRLILMLGAIPAALTFYWRMMMPETARYTALVEQNVVQAAKDMGKVLEVSMNQIAEESPLPPSEPPYPLFSKEFFRRHGRDLFACSCAWFLVDIVFYSNNLIFQPRTYKNPPYQGKNPFEEAFEVAKIQAKIAACSTIPGYWFTVYFIDRVGRVKIQTMGFVVMAAICLVIGIHYSMHWGHHSGGALGFRVLYGLIFFFSNFGPNTTTFIVPAELFPARFRSTCHGISGAAGKVGAIIGSVGFLWASRDTASLVILAGVCVMGAVVTFLFTPETMERSLEENEIDDEPKELSLIRRRLTGISSVNSLSSLNHEAVVT